MGRYKRFHSLFTRFGRTAYPGGFFRFNETEKTLYLSFDDGPTPEITPWVLDLLMHYKVPATFFLIGKNVHSNRELVNRIHKEGHAIGAHSMNHENGWNTSDKIYIQSIEESAKLLETSLYRPPYGRIKRAQFKALKTRGYQCVFWDCLSYDFDTRLDPRKCFETSIQNAKAGSIVVFHDSLKAASRLKNCLPLLIETWLEEGFTFKTIQANQIPQ